MQVQFNRPVTLKGITYGKGLHSVPGSDVEKDWFFDALVKDGDAVIMRIEKAAELPVEQIAPETPVEPVAEIPVKNLRRGRVAK